MGPYEPRGLSTLYTKPATPPWWTQATTTTSPNTNVQETIVQLPCGCKEKWYGQTLGAKHWCPSCTGKAMGAKIAYLPSPAHPSPAPEPPPVALVSPLRVSAKIDTARDLNRDTVIVAVYFEVTREMIEEMRKTGVNPENFFVDLVENGGLQVNEINGKS